MMIIILVSTIFSISSSIFLYNKCITTNDYENDYENDSVPSLISINPEETLERRLLEF